MPSPLPHAAIIRATAQATAVATQGKSSLFFIVVSLQFMSDSDCEIYVMHRFGLFLNRHDSSPAGWPDHSGHGRIDSNRQNLHEKYDSPLVRLASLGGSGVAPEVHPERAQHFLSSPWRSNVHPLASLFD
ncbi:hypothetical protein [Paraburkholderia sp. BL10I2N1]|uniref:hypothetical protein n=1 Tax=Paraburkholderia sp. BL10I2N1 TaxID=1938796 RepID=UPI0014152DF1|nr:hypothetical protein [Paraburkholderia sp. BL10I2N1]